MHTYINTYIHTYIHTYIYIYTYVHTYIHTYIHTHACVNNKYVYMSAYVHTYYPKRQIVLHGGHFLTLVFKMLFSRYKEGPGL